VTPITWDAEFPAASNAVAVSFAGPLAALTGHRHDQGAAVSVHLTCALTEKTTRETPTSSDAAAAIVIFEFLWTVAPFTGDVMRTVGATVSCAGGDCAVTVAVPALGSWLSAPPNDALI
jgi:hypothetical protein